MRSRRTWARSYCACCNKPALGAAAEHSLQAHRHFRRNAALSVDQFGKRVARDSQRGRGAGNAQTQGLDAFLENNCAGVRGFFHRHGTVSVLVVVDVINIVRTSLVKAEYDSPVGANGHGVKTLQLAFQRV